MHVDGHAFAPGQSDAQAARAGAGHRLRARRVGRALKLSDYPPPWEIETSFIAPDDTIPWNYWMNFIVLDKHGQERRHVDARRRERPEGQATSAISRRDLQAALSDATCPSRSWRTSRSACSSSASTPAHVRLASAVTRASPWFFSDVYDVEARLGHSRRRLRHALLEHDHRTHVRRAAGRPDVPEVSGRLRPLSLRTDKAGEWIANRKAGRTMS